jgi:hypothetical protein
MQVERAASGAVSGARVSNTWVTLPLVGDNASKGALIPNKASFSLEGDEKGPQGSPGDEPAAHQLVGEVTAHQGEDG